MLAAARVEFHAAEQAASTQIEIEKAKNAPLGQAAGELLQLVELAGKIAAADQAPIEVPAIMTTSMPASSSARSTPIWRPTARHAASQGQ